MPQTTQEPRVTNVPPDLLNKWIDEGTAVVIDVREDYEHAEERIKHAVLMPLSTLDSDALRKHHPAKRVVFQCRTGRRSTEAAQQTLTGDEPAFHLAGGLEAWKAAGLPTLKPAGAPKIPLFRQVLLVAGSLVVLGNVLAISMNLWFLVVSTFVGCGLMFAGASGWCGMAMLLSRMPWNKPAPCASCQTN